MSCGNSVIRASLSHANPMNNGVTMYRMIVLLALLLAMPGTAAAYFDAGDPEAMKTFNSPEFRQKIQDRFGTCVIALCDQMVKLTCPATGKPQTHYLDLGLNTLASGAVAAWDQCMTIKKFSGEPADIFTSTKIKLKFGNGCAVKERCADMYYVDCDSAADGPAYYLNNALEQIGTGGGFCMGGHCTGAPDMWKSCVSEVTAELKDKMSAAANK